MPKLIPKIIIQKIMELRKKGYSLPEIQKEVRVGYGTVYRYIQGVNISPEHRKSWFGKRGGSIKRMKARELHAYKKASITISSLSKKEKMIFLSALYWGEGSKSDFNLMNSDPLLIRVFIRGLQEVFHISQDRLRVSISLYEDLDKEKSLMFWSQITGVPKTKFVNVDVIKGKKKGKLPYGMCRVRILKGADMLKYIRALKSKISSFFCPYSIIG